MQRGIFTAKSLSREAVLSNDSVEARDRLVAWFRAPLLSFLLMIAAGWVHRHQLIVIEFLQAEDRLLKDRLRGKRIRFTDAERTLRARKAKAVGRGLSS
jgi:hypothetical protein